MLSIREIRIIAAAGAMAAICSVAEAKLPLSDNSTTQTLEVLTSTHSFIESAEATFTRERGISTPTQRLASYENLSLRQCTEIALEKNFGLLNSRRDLLISQSSYREAEAEFIPFVTLESEAGVGKDRTKTLDGRVETHRNYEKGSVSVLQKFPTGGSISAYVESNRSKIEDRSYTNEASLSLMQPLLRDGGLRRGLANLRASRLALVNRRITDALACRNVALSVIRQYFTILRTGRELEVSLDALEEKRRFLEDTKVKFSLDEIPESEISRAEIQYLQERENVVSRRQNYEDQLEELLILLGLPLETKISIHDITQSLLKAGGVAIPPLDECLADALGNRLELLQSDVAIRQRKISLDTAKNDLLPDLDLSLKYSPNDSADSFTNSYNLSDNNSWDASLSLSVPFPNIGRKETRRRAKLSLEKAQIDRVSRERDISREVKQAFRRVKANESSLRILKRTVEQAKKSLEQELGRFDVGLSTSNDVRTAQDDLFEAQTRYFAELLNYQINIAQLYKAIGRPLY